MKKWHIILASVILLSPLVFSGSCSIVGSDSELKTRIAGFQVSDEQATFMVVLDAESAVLGAEYVVELWQHGKVFDSVRVTPKEEVNSGTGSLSLRGDVYLTADRATTYELLHDLNEKWATVRSELDELEEERAWKMFGSREAGELNYEEIKEYERREAELREELDKLQAWKQGGPRRAGGREQIEFDQFCRTYVRISVRRVGDSSP